MAIVKKPLNLKLRRLWWLVSPFDDWAFMLYGHLSLCRFVFYKPGTVREWCQIASQILMESMLKIYGFWSDWIWITHSTAFLVYSTNMATSLGSGQIVARQVFGFNLSIGALEMQHFGIHGPIAWSFKSSCTLYSHEFIQIKTRKARTPITTRMLHITDCLQNNQQPILSKECTR